MISPSSVMHYRTARKPVPPSSRTSRRRDHRGLGRSRRQQRANHHEADRGATGEVMCARSDERDLRDVLALQREVARTIQRSRHHADAAGADAPGRRPAGECGGPSASSPRPLSHRQATEDGLRKPFSISTRRSRRTSATAWRMPGWLKRTQGLSGYYVHPRESCQKRSKPPKPHCASMTRSPHARDARIHPFPCTRNDQRREGASSAPRSISIRLSPQPV